MVIYETKQIVQFTLINDYINPFTVSEPQIWDKDIAAWIIIATRLTESGVAVCVMLVVLEIPYSVSEATNDDKNNRGLCLWRVTVNKGILVIILPGGINVLSPGSRGSICKSVMFELCRTVAGGLTVILFWCECHRTSLMRNHHWFR